MLKNESATTTAAAEKKKKTLTVGRGDFRGNDNVSLPPNDGDGSDRHHHHGRQELEKTLACRSGIRTSSYSADFDPKTNELLRVKW